MQSIRRILIILFTLILAFSALAFASDPEPEQAPLEVDEAPSEWAVDLDLSAIHKLSEDISVYSKESSGDRGVPATTYSTDDIYNLLYSALRGTASSSTYSLPYIANRLNLTYNILASSNFGISKTYDLLTNFNSKFDIRFDTFLSRVNDYFLLWDASSAGSSADLAHVLVQIQENTEFDIPNNSYSLGQLTGMIWS